MATLLCISTVGSCISEELLYTQSTRASVPSSYLGPPTPLPASESVCPLGPKGGRSNTPMQVRDPIPTTGKKAWHSGYSVLNPKFSLCCKDYSGQLAEGNSAFQRRSLLSCLVNRINGQKHVIFGLWLPSVNVLPVNTVTLLLFFCTVRRTVLNICQKMPKNMEKIFNKKNFHYFFWTPLGRRVSIKIHFFLKVQFYKLSAVW